MKKIDRINHLRKKDFISAFVTTVIAAIVFVLIKNNFAGTPEATLFSYIAVVGGVLTVAIAYFESKSKDPFVTGKTQTMGVMNSFVAAGIVMILGAFRFGLIPAVVVMDILVLLFRELGRNARQKIVDKYMNKVGKIVKDNGKGKYVMNLNSEDVGVYSKENLMVGNNVKVSELKGTYLYVKKVA